MRRDAREALVKQKLEYLASYMETVSRAERESRRINSTGRCYEDDVAELKARQAEIWELLKARQKDEL